MPSSEFVYASLNIRIKSEDLLKLQKFYADENVNMSFLDLDVILSDILYHSKLGEIEAFSLWTWSWLRSVLPAMTLFQAASAAVVIASLYIWYMYGLWKMVPFLLIALNTVEAIQKYLRAVRVRITSGSP